MKQKLLKEVNMETLTWKIDGEFLTNLLRTWFWDEDRSYSKCKELIKSLVPSDTEDSDLDEVTNNILEGRKKFVGINDFDYVDDNVKVRPISDKLEEVRKQLKISEIKYDLTYHAINYVDPYSTTKSIVSAEDKGIVTMRDCCDYFSYARPSYDRYPSRCQEDCYPEADNPTKAGLWLLDEPDTIYDAMNMQGETCEVGSDLFWENIYELTKERPGFESRNLIYRAKVRLSNKSVTKDPRLYSTEYNRHLGFCEPPEKDDSLSSWSGLLSPKGEFYPADFGCHESVAYHILCALGEEMGEKCEDMSNGRKLWTGDYDEALSVLLSKGWIAFRYLGGIGLYFQDKSTYDPTSHWIPTKEQKDIVWEQVQRHDLSTKLVPEIYF